MISNHLVMVRRTSEFTGVVQFVVQISRSHVAIRIFNSNNKTSVLFFAQVYSSHFISLTGLPAYVVKANGWHMETLHVFASR